MNPGDVPPMYVPVYLVNGGSGGTASIDEAAFTAGSSVGTPIMGEDPTSGELLIVQLAPGTRQLASSVTVSPTESSTVSLPSQVSVPTTGTQLLAANVARKRMRIQNIGTTTIYILFGAGT